MPHLAIVGLGPAGCIFLASLSPEKLSPEIFAFESGCIGGDLSRLYGNVVANLTRSEMERAMRQVPAWSSADFSILSEKYSENECPLLGDVCKQMRSLVLPILSKITVKFSCVKKIQESEGAWKLTIDNDEIPFQKVVLCTGAEPRKLNFPKSVIPLEIALSRYELQHFVEPRQSVLVFGTSHSGSLILKNLKECGVQSVSAVYRGSKPFILARDGDPDGLKQESAVIADQITQGEWGILTPKFIPVDRCDMLYHLIREVDHIIYAIGFECRMPPIFCLNGSNMENGKYNTETGVICEGIWGFGIGFPSLYQKPDGNKSFDVGFPAFVSHIQTCLPAII